MAINSDMQSFPMSGFPVLKDVGDRTCQNTIHKNPLKFSGFLVDYNGAIRVSNQLIDFGDANKLASIGRNNVFTNGAAGSSAVMFGNDNTMTLTGTATKAAIVGNNNTVTMGASQTGGTVVGTYCVSESAGIYGGTIVGYSSSGVGTSVGSNCYTSLLGGNDYRSYCIGSASQTSGLASGSLGTSNTVNGEFSLCMGAYNTSSGYAALSFGLAAYTTGSQAVAVGLGVNCNAADAMIVGCAPVSYGATNNTTNSTMLAYESTKLVLDDFRIAANRPIQLPVYTVATLPTGAAGDTAYVTNALAPTWGAAVVGGGAVGVPVYKDSVSWKVG